jgi:[ribosomal protein S5]-alanine N-acetyltransferase
MDVEIVPCSAEHLEKLIEGADAFQKAYQFQPIDGYMPFNGALEYIFNQIQSSQLWHPWLPYLFVFRPDRAVVGLGGFKSVPDAQRSIEIGYSVAPTYQGKGFATSAARQLIDIAFESKLVDCVRTHIGQATCRQAPPTSNWSDFDLLHPFAQRFVIIDPPSLTRQSMC